MILHDLNGKKINTEKNSRICQMVRLIDNAEMFKRFEKDKFVWNPMDGTVISEEDVKLLDHVEHQKCLCGSYAVCKFTGNPIDQDNDLIKYVILNCNDMMCHTVCHESMVDGMLLYAHYCLARKCGLNFWDRVTTVGHGNRTDLSMDLKKPFVIAVTDKYIEAYADGFLRWMFNENKGMIEFFAMVDTCLFRAYVISESDKYMRFLTYLGFFKVFNMRGKKVDGVNAYIKKQYVTVGDYLIPMYMLLQVMRRQFIYFVESYKFMLPANKYVINRLMNRKRAFCDVVCYIHERDESAVISTYNDVVKIHLTQRGAVDWPCTDSLIIQELNQIRDSFKPDN